MSDDYQYFSNKRPDRVYLSRSLESEWARKSSTGEIRESAKPFRIVSKVIDCDEDHKFIKDGKEVSLRITPGGRQEIVAKFYEDTRGIFALQIQKYTTETGVPHNTYFTFTGSEISVLYNFLRNVAILPLRTDDKIRLDDRFVEEIVLSKEQALQLLKEQPELIQELVDSGVTREDVVSLAYRRSQIRVFRRLIAEPDYFETQRAELGTKKRAEDVWQAFFEKNLWIFGYGLNYFLNTPLEGRRLEQVTSGYDFTSRGKRIDALLKTKGIVSSIAFAEIKTHSTDLLEPRKKPYRPNSWAVSRDVAGAVAQIQRTVQQSIENLQSRIEMTTLDGDPTGEQVFLYQPRSFLVVGSLAEFQGEHGINESKYSSFELFRRSLVNPEIITFDELLERAEFIVGSHDDDPQSGKPRS